MTTDLIVIVGLSSPAARLLLSLNPHSRPPLMQQTNATIKQSMQLKLNGTEYSLTCIHVYVHVYIAYLPIRRVPFSTITFSTKTKQKNPPMPSSQLCWAWSRSPPPLWCTLYTICHVNCAHCILSLYAIIVYYLSAVHIVYYLSCQLLTTLATLLVVAPHQLYSAYYYPLVVVVAYYYPLIAYYYPLVVVAYYYPLIVVAYYYPLIAYYYPLVVVAYHHPLVVVAYYYPLVHPVSCWLLCQLKSPAEACSSFTHAVVVPDAPM